MLSRRSTRVLFLTTAAITLMVLLMEVLEVNELPCPLVLAVTLRALAMFGSGASVLLMLDVVRQTARIKLDAEDALLRPAVGFTHCFFAFNLFIVFVLAERMKLPSISWKTPFLMAVSGMSVWQHVTLSRALRKMLSRTKPGHRLKLALLDTDAYPGHFSADLTVEPTGVALPPDSSALGEIEEKEI